MKQTSRLRYTLSCLGCFWAFPSFGVFCKVVPDSYTFPTVSRSGQTGLHNSGYGSSNLGVFFSDFHKVSSWKCRHATKSWESGHMNICVILRYKNTQITKIILTNDRVKMKTNKRDMISKEKAHKINKLSKKQEVPSNKTINKQLQ